MDGMKLSFPVESPPLSVIVALSLSASPVTIDSSATATTTVPTFVFSDGYVLFSRSDSFFGLSLLKLNPFYSNS